MLRAQNMLCRFLRNPCRLQRRSLLSEHPSSALTASGQRMRPCKRPDPLGALVGGCWLYQRLYQLKQNSPDSLCPIGQQLSPVFPLRPSLRRFHIVEQTIPSLTCPRRIRCLCQRFSRKQQVPIARTIHWLRCVQLKQQVTMFALRMNQVPPPASINLASVDASIFAPVSFQNTPSITKTTVNNYMAEEQVAI